MWYMNISCKWRGVNAVSHIPKSGYTVHQTKSKCWAGSVPCQVFHFPPVMVNQCSPYKGHFSSISSHWLGPGPVLYPFCLCLMTAFLWTFLYNQAYFWYHTPQSWRWMQHVPLKHWCMHKKVHSVLTVTIFKISEHWFILLLPLCIVQGLLTHSHWNLQWMMLILWH
jgi:hypothetical protein